MSGHHLPEGILLDICLRLPVKAIGRFRCVNKSLCSLLQSPNFIQMHLNHSTEKDKFKLLISSYSDGQSSVHSMASRSDSSLLLSDYESVEIDYPFKSQNPLVEIIGSCNGLVCLELNRRDVCIWNPSTTEFKKIQTPPTVFKVLDVAHRRGQKGYSYGFGYDSKIGDYKLVRYERCEYVMYLSSGSIYTLGTDTWKKIESRALSLYDVSFADKSGVHVNGVLYWIAARTLEKGDGFKSCLVIVSFNICGESGHEIQLPADISAGQVALSLSMFDGNLCLICDILDVHVEVWVMKDFGEDKGNWAKLFTIDKCGISYAMLIHSLKTGEILFQLGREKVDEPNGLVLYKPKHKRSTVLQMPGPHMLFGIESYFPSLASLKSGTFLRAREFEEL